MEALSRGFLLNVLSLLHRFFGIKASNEESNPKSISGFQHWRNLLTTHHVDTNDTMESEENNEAHPDIKQLRYEPIQNYYRLDILFGKDRATEKLFIGPKERCMCLEGEECEETTTEDRSTERLFFFLHFFSFPSYFPFLRIFLKSNKALVNHMFNITYLSP